MDTIKLALEKWNHTVRWVLVALYAITIVAFASYTNIAPTGILIFGFIFMLIHAPKRYNRKTIIIFMTLSFVVSTLLEDISIHTGFPFGKYHYSSLVANIDQVPFPVGIIYISVSYLSWTLGSIILGHADRHLDKKINVVALPAISTFIMCQFDLVIDPLASTFRNAWVWAHGGGFLACRW